MRRTGPTPISSYSSRGRDEVGHEGPALIGAILRVWRQEGWAGIARRLRARLTPSPRPDPFAPRVAQGLPRPELIELGGLSLESFAAALRLPVVTEPLVSVVIPALDKLAYTLCCLHSLCRQAPAASFEVIVVDDGSTDASPELLPRVPNLVYVRNETTQGFVLSVNRGARAARGPFLLLLNNDTQVQPGWLDELVAAFDDPAVGIAGSKLLYPSGHLQEAGAVLRADGSVELVGLNDDPALPEYNVRREVDHCSGASLMIRRELFLELGGFDEAYAPAYFEDCALSLRVRSRGLKVIYVPGSLVVHHLSVTTAGAGEAAKTRQIEVNRHLLLERWRDVLSQQERVRDIAFYLPQSHLIPAEAREAQAERASRCGLSGFCYHYDAVNRKDLLEPPDFPFCICWAHENEDDRIIESLLHCFEDPRYIRLNGRPLLLVDRGQPLPDVAGTAATWRRVCREAGLGDPYLATIQSAHPDVDRDPRDWGFDAAVEFPPNGSLQTAEWFARRPLPRYPLFRTVMTAGDGSSPDVYGRWLQAMVRQTRHLKHGDERIVFINAWNGWQSDCLEATARALAAAVPS